MEIYLASLAARSASAAGLFFEKSPRSSALAFEIASSSALATAAFSSTIACAAF